LFRLVVIRFGFEPHFVVFCGVFLLRMRMFGQLRLAGKSYKSAVIAAVITRYNSRAYLILDLQRFAVKAGNPIVQKDFAAQQVRLPLAAETGQIPP
jgi:hypothetical protein